MEDIQENPATYVMNIAAQTAVGQGIGIGSYVGIFDVMAKLEEPQTSTKIAELGKWKSRYIKEWLNLMVCGHIVEYNAEETTYYLPDAMRPIVSSYGKSQSCGTILEVFNVCNIPFFELCSCFAQNGPIGVPYSSYTGFREWRKRFNDVTVEWKDLNFVFQLIPGLVGKLESGIDLCDAGCNTGEHMILMAENFPKSRFLGFDITEEALHTARITANERKLEHINFQYQDACNMPSDWLNRFDVITAFDVVHDVPFAKQFLKGVLRVLKPGGIFILADVNVHTNVQDNMGQISPQVLYGISLQHCLPVSLSVEGSEGLGACWGIEMQREYLVEAGFEKISQLDVPATIDAYFVGYKPN